MFSMDADGRKKNVASTRRRRDGGPAARTMIVTDVPSIGVPSVVITDGVIVSGPANSAGIVKCA